MDDPVKDDIAKSPLPPNLQPGLEVYEPHNFPETYPYSTLEPVPVSSLEPSTLSERAAEEGVLTGTTAVPATASSGETAAANADSPPKAADYNWTEKNGPLPPSQTDALLAKRKRKRRLIFIILGVVAIIAIVALGVSLGLTLGKKDTPDTEASNSGSDGSSGSLDSPGTDNDGEQSGTGKGSGSSTKGPQAIRKKSSLAATGWRKEGGGYSIRLFFQDDNNFIRMSSFESSSGKWQASRMILEAKASTSITAEHVDLEGFYDSTNVYVLGAGNCIQEWLVYDHKPTEDGNLTAVCDQGNTKPHKTSRLTMFFPSLYFQDDDGHLNEYTWGKRMEHRIYDWGSLAYERAEAIKDAKGTGLAEVPTTKDLSTLSVFYQREDEKLAEWVRERNEWRPGFVFGRIPKESAIGALAVAPKNGGSRLIVYVLYEDNGNIMVHKRDGTGWEGPKSFDALKGVAVGTAISCITPNQFKAGGSLVEGFELARCYFQLESGQVREVMVNGDSWDTVGLVPIT